MQNPGRSRAPGDATAATTASPTAPTRCVCAAELRRQVWRIGLLGALFKVLLFPSAASTDLAVHAHWKAVVYRLPLRAWYTDTSSPWTLDYPPLFLYFELLLAHLARAVQPALLSLGRAPTRADARFLRATVAGADVALVAGAHALLAALRDAGAPHCAARSRRACAARSAPDARAAALVLLAPALAAVDGMHFQYNAVPLGALLGALGALVRGRAHAGVALFAAAVNLKHTLLPLAPVLGAFTLRTLCVRRGGRLCAALVADVLSVGACFAAALLLPWLPLACAGGADAVAAAVRRLFPFQRGLLHAYWAPNFWALYAAADKMLCAAGLARRAADGDPAAGVIGLARPFRALPNVTPAGCAQLVLAALVPLLAHIMLRSGRRAGELAQLAGLGALAAFGFGWHVHEKNVLVGLVPISAAMGRERGEAAWLWFGLLVMGGTLGVAPLVGGAAEAHVRGLHALAYAGYVIGCGAAYLPPAGLGVLLAYLAGCVAVDWYGAVHGRIFGDALPFLPLLLTSVYSAAAILPATVGLFVALSQRHVHEPRGV